MSCGRWFYSVPRGDVVVYEKMGGPVSEEGLHLMATPIYTCMFEVQQRYGVSEWTVRRWTRDRLIAIHKRCSMSFVRHDDMVQVMKASCGA